MQANDNTSWELLTYGLCSIASVVAAMWIARRLKPVAKRQHVIAGAASFMIAAPLVGTLVRVVLESLGVVFIDNWRGAVLPAIVEETTRTLVLLPLVRRDCRAGIWFGAGYGAAENLLLAFQALAVALLSYGPLRSSGLVNHLPVMEAASWFGVGLGSGERLVAIMFQMAYSLFVAAGLARRQAWPILLAILLHFAVDSAAMSLRHSTHATLLLALSAGALAAPALLIAAARMTRHE